MLLILFVLGATVAGPGDRGELYARTMIIPDADNEFCPVTGEKIEQKRFFRTFKGKRYWFSSPAARRVFDNDPALYENYLESPEVST